MNLKKSSRNKNITYHSARQNAQGSVPSKTAKQSPNREEIKPLRGTQAQTLTSNVTLSHMFKGYGKTTPGLRVWLSGTAAA